MKIERLKSAHKSKSPIASFFGLLLMLLIFSLSIGVTHGFAKEKISGYVRTSSGNEISGVTVTFSNGEGSATTNSSGYYSQQVKEGWSGTATPSKVGYNFDPAYRNYSNVKKNKKNQDYTGIVQTRAISGYIRTVTGNEFSGVTVTFDNGGGTGTTDSSGYYSREVTYGWGGTVTPSKDGYSFVPVSRSYVNVIFNQSNQDHTGTQDPSEPSSNQENGGGDDAYGCFVGSLH
ncbi:MAG: carboxypeptidase-like regulatory domain-containing protein [Desulfobacterales bacterium]|nr:carboxypeptidase-like regulatory domain-containing protein [Desulfobacterales bacterium]MDX2512710.1 carboxypeptidase-like regulatory domain-containing protein [Desulfobacterales bacterium]